MKKISATLILWAETVFFNACILMLAELITGNFWGVLEAIVFLFFATVGSIPLLIIVYVLLVLSTKLTCYTIAARVTWLTFNLMVLIVLVYSLISMFTTDKLFKANSEMTVNLGYTLVSLLCSILLSRSTISKLFAQNNQPH